MKLTSLHEDRLLFAYLLFHELKDYHKEIVYCLKQVNVVITTE